MSLRDDVGFLVGVDLGSFHTRVVVTNIRGALVYKQELAETGMPDGRDLVLSRTMKKIHEAIDDPEHRKMLLRALESGIQE